MQNFTKKQKCLLFRQKIPLLYFWARILKNYCNIWNHQVQMCLNAKFCKNTAMPKLCIENALFGYLWGRIRKPLSYFKSASSNLSNWKSDAKLLNLGSKNLLLRFFWPKILKKYCHLWNHQPQMCLIRKFHKKKRNMFSFGTKNALFVYF